MKKFEKIKVTRDAVLTENGCKFLLIGNRKIYLGDEKCTEPEWYIKGMRHDEYQFIAFPISHSAVVISGPEQPQALRVEFSSGVTLTVTNIWEMKRGYVIKPLGHGTLQHLNSGGYILKTLGVYSEYQIIDAEDEYVLARENNNSGKFHLFNLEGEMVVLEGEKKYANAKITLPTISTYYDWPGDSNVGDIFSLDGTLLKKNEKYS